MWPFRKDTEEAKARETLQAAGYTGSFRRMCQTALNIDPGSASNFDPLDAEGGTPRSRRGKGGGAAQPG